MATFDLETAVQILLSNGERALVSPEDAALVSVFKWSKLKVGYAQAYMGGGRKNPRRVYMHRLIMNAPTGLEVDHINGDKLDNRRENLRLATRKQNSRNLPARARSGYRGVAPNHKRWAAQITVDGQMHYLGTFNTPEEAALRYDHEARACFGDFARLNFPQEVPNA